MRNGPLGALEESASFITHCNGNVKGEEGRVGEKEEEGFICHDVMHE